MVSGNTSGKVGSVGLRIEKSELMLQPSVAPAHQLL